MLFNRFAWGMRLALLLMVVVISGCGPGADEFNKVVSERDALALEVSQLKEALDEVRYDPKRLLGISQAFYDEGKFEESRTQLELLLNKHPDVSTRKQVKALLAMVEAKIFEVEAQKAVKAREAEQRRKDALARATGNMEASYDEVRGITWYVHRKAPSTSNGIYLYVGQSDEGGTWLRMVVRYKAEDWLFVNGYTLSVDGAIYEKERVDFKRDNAYGKVWEWSDTLPEGDDLDWVKRVMDSKKTILRFRGQQYYKDYIVPAGEKRVIRETLMAFDALKRSAQG